MGELDDRQDMPPRGNPKRHLHGHRDRLRQRILKGDGSGLAEYELLELLLCAFIPRRDVKPIAKEMIAQFGSVSAALGASPNRLMEIEGLGESSVAYIRATHLLLAASANDKVKDRPVISNWAALLNLSLIHI